MHQKHWQPLKRGDLIDIVAPGMRPKPHTLRGVAQFLDSWGLKGRMADDLVGKDLICSNSREYRFESLKKALLAKDSKMVWCLRGGYGSLQLLKELSRVKPKTTKIFMGLSDITSLHTFLVQHWNWPTIHGANMDRFALGMAKPGELRRFRSLLFGQEQQLNYKLKPLNDSAQEKQKIRSTVIGGNMITLQSSFGTSHQMQTKNRILFFEEIGERAYKIHRIFEHMDQLQMFKGVSAVIFGQFTGGREPDGKNLVPKLLKEFAAEQKFPVYSGIKSGHGENQHPLPLGTKTLIYGHGSDARMEIETGARLDE